jgi:uncharacterized membrane protein YccC
VLSQRINLEYLTHGIKTVIACVIGILITHIIGAPAGPWIVITIIVVMCAQMYVGSVLQKAYFRFIGTVIGSLLGIGTLFFFGDNLIAIIMAVSISAFIFSYIAISHEKYNYFGTLGAVTTAIILLGQHPTIPFAIERFFEISIGIVIAAVISQFVLPMHARIHLRRAQATTLVQIRDFYLAIMDPEHANIEKFDLIDLDENIIKSLFKQRQLANESTREPLAPAFSQAKFMDLLICEREMLRATTFMHHALSHSLRIHKSLAESDALKHFNLTVTQSLNKIAKVITANKPIPEKMRTPSLRGLKEDVLKSMLDHTQEEKIHLDGFLFSVEVFVVNLRKLAKLLNVIIE